MRYEGGGCCFAFYSRHHVQGTCSLKNGIKCFDGFDLPFVQVALISQQKQQRSCTWSSLRCRTTLLQCSNIVRKSWAYWRTKDGHYQKKSISMSVSKSVNYVFLEHFGIKAFQPIWFPVGTEMKLGDMPAIDVRLLNDDDAHTLGPPSLLEPLMDNVSQNHWRLPVACFQLEFIPRLWLHYIPPKVNVDPVASEAMLRENGDVDADMDLHQQLAVQQSLATRDLAIVHCIESDNLWPYGP